MRQFTAEEIQAQFEKLPQSTQEAVTSSEVHDNLIAISKKHNLMIDQEGELVDQVGLVMLGLSPSRDFVKNFSSKAGIDTKKATGIAEDINTEIFSKIKASMRAAQEKIDTSSEKISDVGRAGNFTIEHEQGMYPENDADQSIETPAEIVKNIENPKPVEPHVDTMLVDHLLSGPVVAVEQKKSITQQSQAPQKQAPQQSPKKTGPDLYREPIE